MGYAAGVSLAAILATFAVATRIGTDFLSTLTAMFNPLPAIALLPLALLWFGLGNPSLIFVLIHSVLWPVSLNTHSGFLAVSETLRMAGNNYGLTGIRFVLQILIPDALPSIVTGLKIGWTFAWRTLIAAALVVAERTDNLLCQDTGIPIYNVVIGSDVALDGAALKAAIRRGCERATREYPLRSSVVHPVTRKNEHTSCGRFVPVINIDFDERP